MSDKKSMKTSNKIKSPVMKGFEAGLRSKGNFVSSCENPGAALKLFMGAEAFGDNIRVELLSLIHISEPRDGLLSRMPSSA